MEAVLWKGKVGKLRLLVPALGVPLPNLSEKGCGKGPCFLPQLLVLTSLLVILPYLPLALGLCGQVRWEGCG